MCCKQLKAKLKTLNDTHERKDITYTARWLEPFEVVEIISANGAVMCTIVPSELGYNHAHILSRSRPVTDTRWPKHQCPCFTHPEELIYFNREFFVNQNSE